VQIGLPLAMIGAGLLGVACAGALLLVRPSPRRAAAAQDPLS
jgi:hypothetical protein